MRGFIWAIVMLLVGSAAGASAVWLGFGHMRVPTDPAPVIVSHPEDASADPVVAPALSLNAAGEVVVRLDADVQQHVGLTTAVLDGTKRRPGVVAYGVLQEDPGRTFALHASIAGQLNAASEGAWPDLHAIVEEGALVGVVDPRLTLMEQIDLDARLTQARADAAEAEAALQSARSSYEHKRVLNVENKAVSDRTLEEASAAVQSQEARLEAAKRIVALVEAARKNGAVSDKSFELTVPFAGEVVDVAAQPGEAVEPGQLLLRLASFDTLIARVELPIGVAFDPSSTTALIELVGTDTQLPGDRIALGTSRGMTPHGTELLFRIDNPEQALRPGAPVIAKVPAPGGERTGVLIPRAAVIRVFGRTWVYIAAADGAFIRRELVDGERVDESWFTVKGFAPGDHVVTTGAQVLLSEELKAQIEREETASE